MSHGCGTVIAIIQSQRDDVRSCGPRNVIQEAAMNAESKLFRSVKIRAEVFFGSLAAQELAFSR
jgi:hypothetical protein